VTPWIERGLFAVGIVCLTWSGSAWVHARLYQRNQQRALDRMVTVAPPETTKAPMVAGSVIGTLEVPRLGLVAVVAEGEEDRTLKGAVGHLADTPLPWESGNSALAAIPLNTLVMRLTDSLFELSGQDRLRARRRSIRPLTAGVSGPV